MHYYNEFDHKAAAWLRALMADGLIPKGDVDERSITEVQPADLVGYVQCHFFAGIGGWVLALRLAGWPEDKPVWTGSCPCQPFSSAGKQKAQNDDRHLWPAFFELIRGYNAISQRAAIPVFGEQVSSAIRHGWLDGIRADLEGEGYTCGHAVLGAHSEGSPHIRQRLYWVAYPGGGKGSERHDADLQRRWQDDAEQTGVGGCTIGMAYPGQPASQRNTGRLPAAEAGVCGEGQQDGHQPIRPEHGGYPADERSDRKPAAAEPRAGEGTGEVCSGGLGHTPQPRLEGLSGDGHDGDESRRLATVAAGSVAEAVAVGGVADSVNGGSTSGVVLSDSRGRATGIAATEAARHGGSAESTGGRSGDSRLAYAGHGTTGTEQGNELQERHCGLRQPSPWDDFYLIPCRDGKARRVGTGLRCLAHGVPGRVAQLRGLGNAIVPQVAAEFIQAVEECLTT